MPKTYNDLYIALRKRLKELCPEACSLEARLLLAHAAGKTTEKLLQDLQLYTSPEIEQRLEELAARRFAGEPIAYITGKWEFYGLEFTVTPDVLIPRADTEVLVEKTLELVNNPAAELRILDLCTGSGCIGCALGHTLPRSRVVLADLSREALHVAKQNAHDCGLGTRAICVETDVLLPPPSQLGSFDLIVSNPPSIERDEIPTLDVSVRAYEPHMALDGGEDGLDFYRFIAAKWKTALRLGGTLIFEVGIGQAPDVEEILAQNGYENIQTTSDSQGIWRVVEGTANN